MFQNYFQSPVGFNPQDPSSFNYVELARALQQKGQLGDMLRAANKNWGTTPVSQASATGGILASALGGFLRGKAMKDERQLDKDAKNQADHYRKQLAQQKAMEELQREAETFYPAPENLYTYKDPTQVGPQFEPTQNMLPPQQPSAFSPNVGRSVNRAEGGNYLPRTAATVGAVQPSIDLGAPNAATAARMKAQGKTTTAQGTPLPQAPAAPQSTIPPAAVVYGIQPTSAGQAPTSGMPTLESQFNVDTGALENTRQSRLNFINDALKRQELERQEALTALETNPYGQSFLKRLAAQQDQQASRNEFMFRENYKAQLTGNNGNKIRETISTPNGLVGITNNGEVVQIRDQNGTPVMDAKTSKEQRAEASQVRESIIKARQQAAEITKLISSGDIESAGGFLDATIGLIPGTPQKSSRLNIEKQLKTGALNVIQELANSRVVDSNAERAALEATVANIDWWNEDSVRKGIADIQKFVDNLLVRATRRAAELGIDLGDDTPAQGGAGAQGNWWQAPPPGR